ncbi:beta 1-4 rhamnosyltransferase Cps2T [Clostridium lundense]|uniref:beta 1-4 rhamnosyltransferase Cps2T n=1 Tax=Clostridium lundense TaxID=319475 RepID=UPI000A06BF36|nr:glycosyltransferase family 1 protein [Clostridium lundense]
MIEKEQHVFIIGCKGIPAQYGGYETFIDKLTQYHVNKNIIYHIACAVDDIKEIPKEFECNGAHCFNIQWKKLGAARAIFYDIDAIKWSLDYVKKNHIKHPVFYILACRIGPFIVHYKKQIKSVGGQLLVNPDGHEWMRAKWSAPVRRYWKISERLMVNYADLLICDSRNIEKYIHEEYSKYNPNTTFIAYGSDTKPSLLKDDDNKFVSWLNEKGLKPKEYYLVVGRFVPENNYETMIKEFMKSNTKKNFALITNVSDKFLQELKIKTQFDKDSRIKFVGTVYDQELLKKIREQTYGYFHGHEVGGTNPSLLEALGSTDLNLLLDVGFNKEVGEDAALYWNKKNGNLAALINEADNMDTESIQEIGIEAKKRISDLYSWEYIVDEYEKVFLK